MNSDKNVLMVIAPKDFNEEELSGTRKILEDGGVGVKIASLLAGECYGMDGNIVSAEVSVMETNPVDFDAVIFIGGAGVPLLLGEDSILGLAKEFFTADDKLVCAICWAPVILAKAGILHGRRVAVWEGGIEPILKSGATLSTSPVCVDGRIITAKSSDDAEQFGQAILGMLQ